MRRFGVHHAQRLFTIQTEPDTRPHRYSSPDQILITDHSSQVRHHIETKRIEGRKVYWSERQSEFLFADGPCSVLQPPDPRAGFYREVAQVWNLPFGRRVRVLLREHDLPEVSGRLELERSPDLPLNPREPLQLSAGGVAFLNTQMQAWSLTD